MVLCSLALLSCDNGVVDIVQRIKIENRTSTDTIAVFASFSYPDYSFPTLKPEIAIVNPNDVGYLINTNDWEKQIGDGKLILYYIPAKDVKNLAWEEIIQKNEFLRRDVLTVRDLKRARYAFSYSN